MTFVVTSTADSGTGSLRQAIIDSNVGLGYDTITFNIPAWVCAQSARRLHYRRSPMPSSSMATPNRDPVREHVGDQEQRCDSGGTEWYLRGKPR